MRSLYNATTTARRKLTLVSVSTRCSYPPLLLAAWSAVTRATSTADAIRAARIVQLTSDTTFSYLFKSRHPGVPGRGQVVPSHAHTGVSPSYFSSGPTSNSRCPFYWGLFPRRSRSRSRSTFGSGSGSPTPHAPTIPFTLHNDEAWSTQHRPGAPAPARRLRHHSLTTTLLTII